jgi:hypothetical protein
MNNEEEAIRPDTEAHDELEAIHGIGPTFAQALHKVGIHHYADLSNYTPEKLSLLLSQEAGVKAPAERIETKDWIGQARQLAAKTTAVSGNSDHAHNSNSPAATEAPPPKRRQHAGFSIFFDYTLAESGEREWQTRVYHEESGTDTALPGLETQQWVKVILEKAALPVAEQSSSAVAGEAKAAPVVESETAAPLDVAVEIVGVNASRAVGQPAASDKALAVDVHFRLKGADAQMLMTGRQPFQVEVQSIDVESGNLHSVDSGYDHLQPGIDAYAHRLLCAMPPLGRYELRTTVSLLSRLGFEAHMPGYIVNVVP